MTKLCKYLLNSLTISLLDDKAILLLQFINQNIEIQNIPPCLLKEKYLDDLIMWDEKSETFVTNEVDKRKSLTDIVHKLKIKPNICQKCAIFDKCEGIWQEYYDLYGDKELKPF